MGIFSAGRRIEEAKTALVAKYLFQKLSIHEKNEVLELANVRLSEGGYNKNVDQLEEKVQWIFWGLAMAELGIDHGLHGFRWIYVKNPFMTFRIKDNHWKVATDMLNKKYHLNI